MTLIYAYNLRKWDSIVNGSHDYGCFSFPFSQRNQFNVSLKGNTGMENSFLTFLNLMAARPPVTLSDITNSTAGLQNIAFTEIFEDLPETALVLRRCYFQDNGKTLLGTVDEDNEMCELMSRNPELSLSGILTDIGSLVSSNHLLLGNMDVISDQEFRQSHIRKLCNAGAFNARCINNWIASRQSTADYGHWFSHIDQDFATGTIESARSLVPTRLNHTNQTIFFKNYDFNIKQSCRTA